MDQLAHLLQELETLDLISLKKGDPHFEYAFKHVFTQESIYNSLLRAERRRLHRHIGEALEQTAGNNLDELAPLLAYHFEQSDDRDKAVKYLSLAADRAFAAFANHEALDLYNRALALLNDDDFLPRWKLLSRREQTLNRLGDRNRQANTLTLMQALAELMADAKCQAITHHRRAAYFDKISEYDASAEPAQAGLQLAQTLNNPHLQAESFNLLAQAAWRRFDYRAVQQWANRAMEALKMAGDLPNRTTGLLHLGRAGYRLGEYDAALNYIRAAQELTTHSGDKDGEARCHLILGWIYQRLGRYDTAAGHFLQTMTLRRAIGDRYGEATALSHLGWVAYDQGRFEEGLTYCRQALELSQAVGDRENEAYALSGMGLAAEGLGHAEQARQYYTQALTLHRAIKAQTLAMFDASRLATLALNAGDPALAYRHSRDVIAWTSEHGAEQFWDPWLIHYTNYLVLQANHKPDAAQAILTEAHALLQTRAARISDPELRTCFLQNVPVNRRIAAAWQAEHPTA